MKKNIKNSWYLSKPLSSCKNLFKKDSHDYQAHFYYCECGKEEVIVSSNEHRPFYECEACNNQYFINAYDAINGESIYLSYEGVDYTYECEHTKDGFKASACIYVPYDTNFMQKRLLFKKQVIHEYEIFLDNGKVRESISSDDKGISLKKYLSSYIIDTYSDTRNVFKYVKNEIDEQKKLDIILFYLGLPKFLEFKFYFWKLDFNLRGVVDTKKPISIDTMLGYLLNNRKERSLKRALFKKYIDTFWNEKYNQSFYNPKSIYTFDPVVPFIIARCFGDPNIASKLLSEDLVLFNYDDNERENLSYALHDVIWFIMFLKKYYSEKQISTFLLEVKNELSLWQDILALIPDHKSDIKRYFRKIKLNVLSLHNEIIFTTLKGENQKRYHVNFVYEQQYNYACVKYTDMEFRLPYTGEILALWGYRLHNCLSGYLQRIKHRYTTVYGVFRNDVLLYAVEITDGVIHQMSGKYNVPIISKDAEIIKGWYINQFKEKISKC